MKNKIHRHFKELMLIFYFFGLNFGFVQNSMLSFLNG